MENLKYLELQRLIKELQFVESDYIYKSEIINQSEVLFTESVNKILDEYPDLKNIWNVKIKSNNILLENSNVNSQLVDVEVIESIEISPNVKKIYREIVKNTHPDMVKNKKLNELYLEATSAYELSDIVTLYKVGNELMIDFPWNVDEIQKVELKIDQYKNQIEFLESTYTFKWLKSNDVDKNKIILKFIENRIR
jgi:hypothetical protein